MMRLRTLSVTLFVTLTTLALLTGTLTTPKIAATTNSTAAAAATVPKVFAHYFPPYPISLDGKPLASDYYTKNYLSINGEGGKFARTGGLLRDRPSTLTATGTDYKLANLKTEVRQAKAAGLDGFTVNLMGTAGANWTAAVNLMKAARDVGGFTIIPMVDSTGTIAGNSPAVVAAKLAELYSYPSAQLVGGQYALSSFKAEGKSVAWWKSVITALETTHKKQINFIADFISASDANLKAFAPISYGFGNWGVRTVDSVQKTQNYVAKAHAMGKKWMSPIAFQDARQGPGQYAESFNSETFRAGWTKAIKETPDFVQLITWNDYSESTQLAPSRAHGNVFLDIGAYYIKWLKGAKPAITADHLYVTHRVHPFAATPVSGLRTNSWKLGGMWTPPRDTVEALVMLTAPATVTITSGGASKAFSLPAGVSSATIPLKAGTVSAKVTRGATTTKAFTSPFPVTNTPKVLDFAYHAVGN